MLYRIVTWTIMPLTRWRIWQVRGLEHVPRTGPMLLVANHTSWMDPVLIGSVVHQVVRRTIYFIAASRKYRRLGGLPIRSESPGGVIHDALERLRAGWPVSIFPAGNVRDGSVLPRGRTGAARLALWADVPVIPIGIRGIHGRSLIHSLWSFLTSRRIELVFGAPLVFPTHPVGFMSTDYLQNVADCIMTAIARLSGKQYPYVVSNVTSDPDSVAAETR